MDKAEVKAAVRERYGQIAEDASGGGCGSGGDPIVADLYAPGELADVPVDAAAASLGCGNPVALATLREGETVLDLGSGGGIDVLLSAKRVGPAGMAYGLDMTDEMLALANRNRAQSGLNNVEFLKGEIEDIPLPDGSVDVIISNCVVNLSPEKGRVLAEACRVLKPGGRLAIADIVLLEDLPEDVRDDAAAWTGCVAGALPVNAYLSRLLDAGFANPSIEVTRAFRDASGAGAMAHASAFIRATKPPFGEMLGVTSSAAGGGACGGGSSCC
ncbi:MAG: arsenite methyltransferase [Dehalococcoidia bacterium]|nr:arsenite methyltransferase [Dehalococcoidia bacterium]